MAGMAAKLALELKTKKRKIPTNMFTLGAIFQGQMYDNVGVFRVWIIKKRMDFRSRDLFKIIIVLFIPRTDYLGYFCYFCVYLYTILFTYKSLEYCSENAIILWTRTANQYFCLFYKQNILFIGQ